MNKDIRGLVAYYKNKFNTNNPFEIADNIGILYQYCELNFEGCYMFLKKHRYIFINKALKEHEMRMVMAHELGHAILHQKNNCYFIKNRTLLLNSKMEREANTFAAELLISDEVITENINYTTIQLSRILEYDIRLIELRLESYCKL